MFKPGDILVITEAPITFVTVAKNLGARPGMGWLLTTREGNAVLVRTDEKDAGLKFLQHVIFITDMEQFTAMLEEINRAL